MIEPNHLSLCDTCNSSSVVRGSEFIVGLNAVWGDERRMSLETEANNGKNECHRDQRHIMVRVNGQGVLPEVRLITTFCM